ncbi:MAG: glycoside hydrolase family 99-like domain-containing protein [Candidatus Hodarchaeota archaeon]
MLQPYDIAAYVWPAYHDEPRWREFMPGGEGEWETMRRSKPMFEGHYQPRVPMWGYTDESDPKDMAQKIEAAIAHHVNVFIFDWYWYENQPFLEEALNEGFLKARNCNEMGFFLMWANHDASTLWMYDRSHEHEVIWPGSVTESQFETIMDRVIARYFSYPSYYKIDGCPVFSTYEVKTLVNGLGGTKKTKKALDLFRKKVKDAGFPGLHLQAIAWKVNRTLIKKLGFDSITSYQWAHHVRPKGPYEDWAGLNVAKWEEWNKKYPISYFPHVSIGWDTNPRFKVYKENTIVNNKPELFGKYMEHAMEFIKQNKITPPLITVNSWNEWCEGSYLEPDMKYKMAYLEAVKKAVENKR